MRLSSVFLFFLLGIRAIAGEVTVTVMATTDMHGNILPYDYLTGTTVQRGFAKIATLIRAERQANPNTMLIDVGDTIQGTPMESVWQQYVRTGKLAAGVRFHGSAPTIDPMMLVMNHLGYESMTVGNHEFNFGLKNLDKARSEANFPWIAANIKATGDRRPFAPFVVKTVAGVKIAVIGLTTPAVPMWEKPENIHGYTFTNARDAARDAVTELREKHKPDLIIAAIHAGLERDPRTGRAVAGDAAGEYIVNAVATGVPGIDAIVFGHTHQMVEDLRIGNVMVTQPKNWAASLARMQFIFETTAAGGYRLKTKSSHLIPVTDSVQADPEVVKLAQPYHLATEQFLTSQVTESEADLSARYSRVQDTAIIDAVQAVQMHYAKADVSFSASFNPRARVPKGPVTVRQIAALYIYDNELYAISGTGKMVRAALENAARYFKTCPDPSCATGPLIDRSMPGFNYDMAEGVTYDIDLRRPPGDRIQNLSFRGEPLQDGQRLRIAVNNYRAAGSAGYGAFRHAPVVWRSYEDIRELIIRYYSEHKLPSKADGNWRIIPEGAQVELQKEAEAEASRVQTR